MTKFDPAKSLSTRTSAIAEGAILAMAQKARDLKASGADVISLTIGEPDFDTPEAIRQAAADAMNAGHTHYVPIAGIAELREAIAAKLRDENGIPAAAADVVLANGAKQAITNACFATLDAGDEVILPAPFWNAYQGIVEMAGGVPVVIPSTPAEAFKPPLSRIAEAMNERTKLIFINSPSNPSGAVWTAEELEELARLVQAHPRCLVVADEIYEYIWFDAPPRSIASLPGMYERTITINGLSKGFAMTGWRVGYAAAPAPLARAITKIQGTFTAGGNAFAQHGALAAITGPRDEVEKMRVSYKRRRDLAVAMLKGIEGVNITAPPATFYILADIAGLLGKTAGNTRIETDTDFCNWLLEEYHVATVPGSAFGAPGCIRFSVATRDSDITKGLERLARAANALS
ncbi:MAG: pyridoxal phosphate-dependent aminotransferase [Anderseniella sp.]|nr:pyridoxal phosphate-dependent aminotransferase [Anderseniella sp.]